METTDGRNRGAAGPALNGSYSLAAPHTAGWLRRPELDAENGGMVWEKPDGVLHVQQHDKPLVLMVWRPSV